MDSLLDRLECEWTNVEKTVLQLVKMTVEFSGLATGFRTERKYPPWSFDTLLRKRPIPTLTLLCGPDPDMY
ncbi:hypothetical protein DY000_02035180 [Brassica cretica]|uniref:Uncharacterized protein n=1 Tax=Brassica cretica TaxID=69181 RepID=A0ABQ7DRJ2_BRACR|nr:hypothetical protein DY000_02035180 [Brassica cretica]